MREGIVTKPAWIGKSVARKEDRSPYPHARIVRIDVTGARRLPGEAILTPADVVARTEPLTALRPLPDVPRLGYYAMADGVALYEGQPVVSVVAVDRHVAEDALDLLDIEYEPLPRVSDAETALEPGAPRLHAHLPSNLLIRNPRTAGDPEAAFARADVVIGDRFHINRVTGLPIEGRAILARCVHGLDTLEVWCSTQVPHLFRMALAEALRISEADVRVVASDVGGGFGLKLGVFPEDIQGASSRTS